MKIDKDDHLFICALNDPLARPAYCDDADVWDLIELTRMLRDAVLQYGEDLDTHYVMSSRMLYR